jgi:hypothetical protein
MTHIRPERAKPNKPFERALARAQLRWLRGWVPVKVRTERRVHLVDITDQVVERSRVSKGIKRRDGRSAFAISGSVWGDAALTAMAHYLGVPLAR